LEKEGFIMIKLRPVTVLMAALVMLGIGGTLMASKLTDRIESAAKKSYVFKTYLKGDDIKVEAANDSVVTLTGTVSKWSHRSLAEETVIKLPGVVRVDNKLEAKGGKPDEISDTWITMKVETMLLFRRNVSSKTNVDVKDGMVTLRGKATSEAQRELTTECVKDVGGVKDVKNEMTVEKAGKTTVEKVTEYVDDASITAQVKVALAFHRGTSAISTKVETENGIVTVKGVARNSAEKDLVGKLANDIKGVKDVKNDMSIEEEQKK
jgi:osmotically-inducible protein OsmY